jgi:hypothetical protein
MAGAGSTVKALPLLSTPLARTTTFPVVAPAGTVSTILVALHVFTEAVVPLYLTVLLPCVVPKLVPARVIEAPTAPDVGDNVVMLGAATTVKLWPLLSTPLARTTTFPVVAPEGTVTAMLVVLQVVTVAVVPLNFTVLLPCVDPKFVPVTVTAAPTAPDVIDRLVILGAATTVKALPLLSTPLTRTTTFPVVAPVGTFATMLVALQLVMFVAVVPLNFTVLLPCVEPKPDPAIVTEAPTAPEVGVSVEMVGAARARAGPTSKKRSNKAKGSRQSSLARSMRVSILPLVDADGRSVRGRKQRARGDNSCYLVPVLAIGGLDNRKSRARNGREPDRRTASPRTAA